MRGTGARFLADPRLREYFRGVVYSDPAWDDETFSAANLEFAANPDIGGTATPVRSSNLAAYRDAGGKILQYHGRSDQLVPSALSERWYNGAAMNINVTLGEMQEFYRCNFIPGMDHCRRGRGAWSIGTTGPYGGREESAENNAILASQRWVEDGVAPEVTVGTKLDDGANVKVVVQRSESRRILLMNEIANWDLGRTLRVSQGESVGWLRRSSGRI
jgi:hypothetical protein